MNNKVHKLISTLKRPVLTAEDKETLRSDLLAHINGERFLTTQLDKIPQKKFPYRAHSTLLAWRFQVALASILIFVSSGAGIATAAEGSLPGDLLYSIKTGITEPIARIAKANNPVAKALFETRLLEKRLSEAEQLITKDEKTAETVKVQLKESVHTQKKRAEKATKDASPKRAASLREKTVPPSVNKEDGVRVTREASDDEIMTFSLTATAPAEDTSAAGATVTAESAADQVAITAESDDPEEATVKELDKVVKKHRLILEKLEVNTELELDE